MGVLRRPALALAAAAALVLAGGAAPSAADAAQTKSCPTFQKRLGGQDLTWRVQSIRLTRGFSCRDAKLNVSSWISLGAKSSTPKSLTPWTCTFDARIRCRLRTSFGGSRPMRTYRLSFRISVPPQ